MSNQIGFAPVHVDASDFGWTSRKRLTWCDAFVPEEWKGFVNTDTYSTKSWHTLNIPRRRRKLPPLGSIFKSPFKPLWLTNNSTPDHPEGRFAVITRSLTGQTPHGFQRSSEDARRRCEEAGKTLPVYWFETANLVWQEKPGEQWEWRLPTADEAEGLMGFPGAHTHVPTEPGNKKSPKLSEATRWDLIANSWHVPCLRFWALCILFSTGVQPSTAEFAASNLYLPWEGSRGTFQARIFSSNFMGSAALPSCRNTWHVWTHGLPTLPLIMHHFLIRQILTSTHFPPFWGARGLNIQGSGSLTCSRQKAVPPFRPRQTRKQDIIWHATRSHA